MQSQFKKTCLAMIIAGSLAGTWNGMRRFLEERHNRRVSLAVDLTEVKTLSQALGIPLSTALQRLKTAGATSVAITEETLTTLENAGEVVPRAESKPNGVDVASPETLHLIKQGLIDRGFRVTDSADSKISTVFEATTDQEGEVASDTTPPEGFAVNAEWSVLRNAGIGIDPRVVTEVLAAGLEPVARIGNYPGANQRTMTGCLQRLKSLGIVTVIFQGLEVFGYRGEAKSAAAAFRESGMQFAQVEFGKQKGDDALATELKGAYIRAHSIAEGEMSLLDEREALDRFVRAARERNIRLCYVRLVTLSGDDPLLANARYLQAIRKGISRGGEMGFGPAKLYPELAPAGWTMLLIGLGIGGGLALILTTLFPGAIKWTNGFGIAVGAILGLVCMIAPDSFAKFAALVAALVFPTLACLVVGRTILELGAESDSLKAKTPIRHAVMDLIRASIITLPGILSIVGLLATREYIVKTHQFMGIKPAHAIPVAVTAILAVVGLPRVDDTWKVAWRKAAWKLREQLRSPLTIGLLIATAIGMILLVLIVARTGNEPGVGVSGIELKFRSLLDRALPVRPRTKEFLLGHPAWVLGLALWYRYRYPAAKALFVVGVIGQVSILNTFCHIHSPLWLNAVRDIVGLIIGAAIGAAAAAIVFRIVSHSKPTTNSTPT